MADAEPIGERLRRLRRERGLSQRELASPGVSYAYISRIEAGTRRPSVKALRMLARKLGVSPEYLETGSELRDVDARELRLADAELELRLGADPPAARERFAALLQEAREAGDPRSAAKAQIGLGLVAATDGDFDEAVRTLQEAVDAGAVTPLERPDVYATLARAYSATGAHGRSVSLLESCVGYVDANDSENVAAYVRYSASLSAALTDLGDLKGAEAVLERALSRADDEADAYSRVRLYWSIARLAEYEGEPARALGFVRKAIALLEVTDDATELARAHLLCAWIIVGNDRASDALPHLEKAEALLGPSAEVVDRAMLRVEQAKAAGQLGRADEAVARAQEALELLGDTLDAERGSAWLALANGVALQGDVSAASDAYARAVELLEATGQWREAAQASRRWARLLREAGRDAEALDALERAADYAVRSQPTAQARTDR